MASVSVPLGAQSWIRDRADEAPIALTNRFFETNPTNTDEQVALIERPVLVQLLTAGQGPGRRLYHMPGFANDALFHVSGSQLYKHLMGEDRGIVSTLISGAINGTGSPDMAATDTYLWIADGTLLQYTDGTSPLISITTPDDIPIVSLDVFNGYVLCVQNNSDRFYWIRPSATIIDPLDFATAERFPDRVLQVRAVGDEVWFLGEKSIEVWRATGDGDAPFQRIEGRAFNFGIWDGSAVRMEDTSVNVVTDTGRVVNIAGVPNPISTPSVAERTRDAILASKETGL